jgi:hypothetical protein
LIFQRCCECIEIFRSGPFWQLCSAIAFEPGYVFYQQGSRRGRLIARGVRVMSMCGP